MYYQPLKLNIWHLIEVVKELKFIVQLLQTMNITVELPITVHVDNVGAMWLSNNRNTEDRTKHIDIRTAFVKEYQGDGKIIIKCVNQKTMRQTYLPRIQATSFFKDTKRNWSGTRKRSLKIND